MHGLGSYIQSLFYDAASVFPTPLGYHSLTSLAPDFFEYRRLRVMVIMSRRFKYLYMVNPKVASTSIRNRLHELNGHDVLADPRDVMGHRQSSFLLLKDMAPGEFVKIVNSPEFFKFSFVRNPFSRLVSGYVYFQRELKETLARGEHPKRYLISRRNDPRLDPLLRRFLEFDEFIQEVCREDSPARDQHFRLQTEILKIGLIEYDFIGRMESFVEDMSEVLDRLEAPHEIRERVGERTNATKKSRSTRDWYTPELADRVRKRFAPDFDEFEYSLDLPED